MTTCSLDGCGKPHLAKGLCRMHYYRLRNTGSTDARPPAPREHCSVEGCPSVVKSRSFCNRHYQQWRAGGIRPDDERTTAERFWSRVDKTPDGCWPWTGKTSRGYGYVRIDGVLVGAHRFAWQLTNGPIPAGREIDHRCHDSSCRMGDQCPHRRCVNPAHLKAVTHLENMAPGRSSMGAVAAVGQRGKTHCPRNHPYDEANTYVTSSGYRHCRACNREKSRLRRSRNIL